VNLSKLINTINNNIHKNSDKQICCNCRLISSLNLSIAKIFEKYLKDKLFDFIIKRNFFQTTNIVLDQ